LGSSSNLNCRVVEGLKKMNKRGRRVGGRKRRGRRRRGRRGRR